MPSACDCRFRACARVCAHASAHARPAPHRLLRRAGLGWAAGLLLALPAAFAATPASLPAAPPTAARPALTVTVVQPSLLRWPVRVAANGNVGAWQELSIGSQANSGRVAALPVNVGDRVKRGQVLVQLDTALAHADLAQAAAAVAEASAVLAEAAGNAQRGRDLAPTGAISQQQIDQLQTAERTAQARLDAQRAAERSQQLRLRQAAVLAPDDGVVSARSVSLGAVVGAGQELMRLLRHGRVEWRAEVGATDLARIQPGQTVQINLPDGHSAAGVVRLIAPTVDAASRNGLVYVDLPNAGSAKPGMFARGEFVLGESPGLTLPQTALLLRDGFSHVFVLGADSRVRQQKVVVGRRLGDRVELLSGLAADAKVAASGVGFLADGDAVRVVEAALTATPAATPAAPR